MDLTGIINDYFSTNLFNPLSSNLIKILSEHQDLYNLGNNQFIVTHGIFTPYDDFIFNPYFQMFMVIIFAWFLDDFFDYLFKKDLIKIKKKIMEEIKRWLNF
jgi:hypothetical protein